MQVGDDPRAVGERLGPAAEAPRRPPAAAETAVEGVELGRHAVEAVRLDLGARRGRPALAQALVLRVAGDGRRRELRLLGHHRRCRDRGTGRLGLEEQPRRARRRGREDGGLGEDGCADARVRP